MEPAVEYLQVPRESAGDDTAVLIEWLVEDGAQVERGQPVCTVEMSKAAVDLEAPRAGWLFQLCQVRQEIAVGRPVGMIADGPHPPARAEPAARPDPERRVTRKAQALIDRYGIAPDRFDGLDMVRERDVLRVIEPEAGAAAAGPGSEARAVTAIQRRVAQTVSDSAATIPHSYLSRWVPAGSCEAVLRSLCEPAGLSASVTDLLVYSAARAAAAMPKANAAWGGSEVRVYLAVNVGFALNLASGDLVVPVIPAAHALEFERIVAAIRGHQVKALRRKLAPADLVGGTLTVTSLIGTGAQQVFPIIMPGQSAIVSIADAVEGPAGKAHCLTLGFDHRVLNGAEAAQFLKRVADGMCDGLTEGEST